MRIFGLTFAPEKLVEQEGLCLSVTSTRNLMIGCGIWISKKSKKKRVFQMRERRPREGEIIQVDGSDHLWFENRGKRCALLGDRDQHQNRSSGLLINSRLQ